MDRNAITIGRLAQAADVHVETIRYYQRRGLLRSPERPYGGVRRYGTADIDRLQFIRRAQAMGFSLAEIDGLLDLTGQRACEHTRQLTEQKLADVRRRLLELRRLERGLVELVAACTRTTEGACCPTLDRLERREKMPARRSSSPSSPPQARRNVART